MNSNYTTEHSTFAVDYGQQQQQPARRIDIVRMLRQNAPMMIAVSLLIAVPACVAVWFLVPLEYAVSAELLFRANAPTVLAAEDPKSGGSYEKWLTTQLEFLQGPSILQRVADSREVKNIAEVRNAPDALEFLRKKVKANSNRDSEIVAVTVRMKNGNDAKVIVDTVVTQYLEFAHNAEAARDDDKYNILTQEKTTREIELAGRLREINELKRAVGIPLATLPNSGATEVEPTRAALTQGQTKLNEANTKIRQLEDQLETLAGLREQYDQKPSEKIYGLGVESLVDSNSAVTSIRAQRASADNEVRVLRDTVTERNQQLQVAQDRLNALNKGVAEVEVRTRGEALEQVAAKLELDLATAIKDKEGAEESIAANEDILRQHSEKQTEAAGTIAELEEMEREAEQMQKRLAEIKGQIDMLMVERRAPARVTPASPAMVPSSPDYGRRFQLMALAVMGACATGLGLGLLRELTNKHARMGQDIASITTLPVLATIPHSKAMRLPKDHDPEMLVADYPNNPVSEEYRRIVARMVFPPDDTVEVSSCLITSPTRNDGKTTVACNLAIALAQANRRVLLIDICGRNPKIEEHFGLSHGDGLSEVLFDDLPYQSALQSTEFPDLMVLGPGFGADELPGKLPSREMMQFLEDVEKDFDHVIIDTPPSLLMSDAKLLAPIVGGVIVAVGSGHSTLGMVRRAISELDHDNANIIGVVLNGVRHTRGGYISKNLALYNKYSNGNGRVRQAKEELPEMTITDDAPESPEAAVMLIGDDSSHGGARNL